MIMSYSVIMPTTLPSPSTTGSPLNPFFSKILTASKSGVSGVTDTVFFVIKSFAVVIFYFLNYNDGSQLIPPVELHNSNALGGPAKSRNAFNGGTDHLPLIRYRDQLLVFLGSDMGRDKVSGFSRNFGGHYTPSSAVLNFIKLEVGLFAVTVFHDRKNMQPFLDSGRNNIGANDRFALFQSYSDHAGSGPSHGANVFFLEPNRITA